MKIINSTKWDSKDIRKIFMRCVQELQKSERPKNSFRIINRYYRLYINGTSRGMHGNASLGDESRYPRWTGLTMALKIPFNIEWTDDNKFRLARMIIHELFHNLGTRFQDKFNYRNDWSKEWNVDWVKGYQINVRVINSPKIDVKLVRYQRAVQNLKTAETRFKRAKTILNKWQGTVKRYQKVYNYK